MKILILQLARFGDIYMSWPVIRAIKRKNPEAEIHFLVRPRFQEASLGLEAVSQVHLLPSTSWMEGLFHSTLWDENIKICMEKVGEFTHKLKSHHFDQIVNLSFSPLSSFLTHAISSPATEVYGYTRCEDGSLGWQDAISEYFFSQVGESRSNRFHVVDLLASMLEVDLIEEDFQPPQGINSGNFFENTSAFPPVVVHIGASQKKKSLQGFQWARFLKSAIELTENIPFVLVGSPQESDLGWEISESLRHPRLHNCVGKTKISDLFSILTGAQALVGCDSVAVHMASLAGTPTFNLSFDSVNFWETGPLAPGSAVLKSPSPELFESFRAAQDFDLFLKGELCPRLHYLHQALPRYTTTTQDEDFSWRLLLALYLNETFPVADDPQFVQGLEKVRELNTIMMDCLQKVQQGRTAPFTSLLQRSEEAMMTLASFDPNIDVLLRWYRGRKVQVPPLTQEKVLSEYIKIHQEFHSILRIYTLEEELQRKE